MDKDTSQTKYQQLYNQLKIDYRELGEWYDALKERYLLLQDSLDMRKEPIDRQLAMKLGDTEFWYNQYLVLDENYWNILHKITDLLGLEYGKISMNVALEILEKRLKE
jgi:hypothetical protein